MKNVKNINIKFVKSSFKDQNLKYNASIAVVDCNMIHKFAK